MPRYYVHRYDVIRIKVAVDAESQLEAMKAADEFLSYSSNYPIHEHSIASTYEGEIAKVEERGVPCFMHYEQAEEVTGYLVDEAGDEEYANSIYYNAEFEPEVAP
ncbi:hypothetical protein ACQKOE_07265 [Novosphingobium sp. NPDC080210]|uniref:hypothetical protein n=1 Tax=Novosphingobium sp. NPDC080210 TaxID=3390596 RepID=UPI003D051A4C